MPKNRKGAPAQAVAGRNWFQIRAQAAGPVEIRIFGDIGHWDDPDAVDADAFIAALAAHQDRDARVLIDSVGGNYVQGSRIAEAIRGHFRSVTTVAVRRAYSMASLIWAAGHRREMHAGAELMFHAPWLPDARGNWKDLQDISEELLAVTKDFAREYSAYLGLTENEMMNFMDGTDHFVSADSALAMGISDATLDAPLPMVAKFDDSRFHTAATAAQFDEDKPMPVNEQTATPAEQNHSESQAVAKSTNEPNVANLEAAAERKASENIKARNETIRANFRPFLDRDEVRALYDDLIVDPDVTAESAGQRLLAKLAEGAEPASPQGHAPRIEAGQSEQEKFRVGASTALMARAGIQKDEGDNNFRGFTLLEMARANLRASGVDTSSMDKREVVAASFTHTSSDFPALLENIAQKAMLRGYDEAEETFQQWTSVGELSDFKEAARTDLDMFPSLQKVAEGVEYTYATMGERGEKVQLATYGRLFSITRQMIINDDLGAFTRVPMKMGRAAIRTIGDLVYAILNDNPTMADGTALFHADHNNLLTGAGPTTASVDAMRVAMGKQKLGDAHLNIRPAYFVTPLELEGAMRVVMNSEFEVGASSKNNTVPNSVRGIAEVISDARLTGGATPAWYGAANPMMHDTIEVQYLDGNSQPYLEQKEGWNVDGVQMKVRMDAGVKALDFRTLAKNPGS